MATDTDIQLTAELTKQRDEFIPLEWQISVFEAKLAPIRFQAAKMLYEIREYCYTLTTPREEHNNPYWRKSRDYIIEKQGIKLTRDANNYNTPSGRYKTLYERYQKDASLYQLFHGRSLNDNKIQQLIAKNEIKSWGEMKNIEKFIKYNNALQGDTLYDAIIDNIHKQ